MGEGAFLSDNLLSTCTTAAYVDAVSLFYNFFTGDIYCVKNSCVVGCPLVHITYVQWVCLLRNQMMTGEALEQASLFLELALTKVRMSTSKVIIIILIIIFINSLF